MGVATRYPPALIARATLRRKGTWQAGLHDGGPYQAGHLLFRFAVPVVEAVDVQDTALVFTGPGTRSILEPQRARLACPADCGSSPSRGQGRRWPASWRPTPLLFRFAVPVVEAVDVQDTALVFTGPGTRRRYSAGMSGSEWALNLKSACAWPARPTGVPLPLGPADQGVGGPLRGAPRPLLPSPPRSDALPPYLNSTHSHSPIFP